MVQKWGDTMAPRTRKVSYKPQDRPKKTRHEPACEHIHKHQFTDRMQRQRRTHDGVDLVDEDDGGRGEAGALESVAQQGLALAHVHAEQLRAPPAPAAASRCRLRPPAPFWSCCTLHHDRCREEQQSFLDHLKHCAPSTKLTTSPLTCSNVSRGLLSNRQEN